MSGLLVPPTYATKRDPTLPTVGTEQGLFSEIWLRRRLMPHQQLILDVAGEIRPDGLPKYPLVVVTEPRQAGKSHMSFVKNGHRCFTRPGHRAWYTAQTGGDARDQFLAYQENQVSGRPIEPFIRTLIGNGREEMKFANGSTLRPHPPTEGALHGKQSDDNDVDEGWAFTEEEGRAIMQAIAPTQLTRPGAQTWIYSAGGTAASTWLAKLVARGRGGDPTMAYFEWAIPDDLDVNDLEAVLSYHPARGGVDDFAGVTIDSLRTLRSALGTDDDAAFARAAGNRWTEVIGGAIDGNLWKNRRYDPEIPDGSILGYGAATSTDRSETAIVVAAAVDNRIILEVLDVLPRAYGAGRTVDAWAQGGPLAVDRFGPSTALADDLTNNIKRELLDLPTNAYIAACANLVDGLEAGAIWYRQNDELDAAVKVAGKRSVGDGGWVWALKSAAASLATLQAATLAVHALGHRPAIKANPSFRVPGE